MEVVVADEGAGTFFAFKGITTVVVPIEAVAMAGSAVVWGGRRRRRRKSATNKSDDDDVVVIIITCFTLLSPPPPLSLLSTQALPPHIATTWQQEADETTYEKRVSHDSRGEGEAGNE